MSLPFDSNTPICNKKNIVKMVFKNKDATPNKTVINCDEESCPKIASWYGCYYSGDNYTIKINGIKVKKDQNGDFIHPYW